MDMFDIDNVKAEKAKAIFHFNLLKTIQTLFRIAELLILIILVSWTSSRLPFAFKLSGEYFRLLISILANPFSIFIIGNIIVLRLLFKSGHLSTHSPISITTDEDHEICQEHFTGINFLSPINGGEEMPIPAAKTEEIVFEDKETIYEEINNVEVEGPAQNCQSMEVHAEINKNQVVKILGVEKHLMRIKSENLERKVNISKNFGRSKTEKCREILNHGEAAAAKEEVHVFDGLSNEEFQNAIENFIAKQVKFHKSEKLDIVLHTKA